MGPHHISTDPWMTWAGSAPSRGVGAACARVTSKGPSGAPPALRAALGCGSPDTPAAAAAAPYWRKEESPLRGPWRPPLFAPPWPGCHPPTLGGDPAHCAHSGKRGSITARTSTRDLNALLSVREARSSNPPSVRAAQGRG